MRKPTCSIIKSLKKHHFYFLFFIQILLGSIFIQNISAEEISELPAEEVTSIAERETQIIIKSNEKKARVYLNNQFQGLTTMKLGGLIPGTYILRLEKAGSKSKSALIEVEYGKSKTFYFELLKVESKN